MDRLTSRSPYDYGLRRLDHLTSQKGLKSYLSYFLVSCKVDELSPATIKDYRYKIGRFVDFCSRQGVKEPTEITPQAIRLFILELQERQKAISVSGYYRTVKRFINWLIAEDIMASNPMKNIRPPKVPHKIINTFTPEQIDNLLLLSDDGTFTGLRNKAILLMFWDTGLRVSELASIQAQDIDVDKGIVKVMGKGARQRIVRVGNRAMKALLRYLITRDDNQPCLWVTFYGSPLTANGIKMMIKRLSMRAGITGVRCSAHTFRHTAATWSLLNGASEFQVQSMLGHSTLKMTRHYTATLNSEQAALAHQKASPVDNMKL